MENDSVFPRICFFKVKGKKQWRIWCDFNTLDLNNCMYDQLCLSYNSIRSWPANAPYHYLSTTKTQCKFHHIKIHFLSYSIVPQTTCEQKNQIISELFSLCSLLNDVPSHYIQRSSFTDTSLFSARVSFLQSCANEHRSSYTPLPLGNVGTDFKYEFDFHSSNLFSFLLLLHHCPLSLIFHLQQKKIVLVLYSTQSSLLLPKLAQDLQLSPDAVELWLQCLFFPKHCSFPERSCDWLQKP